MINKKYLIVFLILIFSTSCSFDNKTGIWGEGIDEKRRISQLEKDQKKIIDIDKIYSSENLYEKELNLSTNVSLSKPKKNNSWEMIGLNHQNLLGNISLPSANNIFLKKKIGKNKFTITGNRTPILMFKNNIFFSDDTGTIFYIDNYGNLIWKKNIYKKIYKKINKNLVLSTYENKLFVADNIGFLYSIKINTGEIIWIKNHGVSIKSNIKIFNNKAFLIDQDNRIFALRTSDGSKIWNILSISSFIKSQNLLSLAITEQSDLIALSSAGDLYRININTGEVYWTSNAIESLQPDASDFFESSEIVIHKNEIIFSGGSSTFSYNLRNGSINWSENIASVAIPIIIKNNIFLVTKNGYLAIIKKDTGKIIFSNNIFKALKKKYRETKVTGFIMGSGKIYSFTSNGFLIVSSATSGKVEYHKKIGHPIISFPIISNEKLFILTENSKIIGFN